MRIKLARALTMFLLFLNILLFYFVWTLLDDQKGDNKSISSTDSYQNEKMDGRLNITVIIRGFENFENDIPNTVRSVASTYPDFNILIVSDSRPYPPLLFNRSNTLFKNVRNIYLESSFKNSFEARTPLLQIKTQYVLFMPDSARIHTKKTLEKMIQESINHNDMFVAATFKATKPVSCLNTHINLKEWIVQFEDVKKNLESDPECDFIKGKHATLLKTEVLKSIADPFMLPFPDSFYLQAAANLMKTRLMRDLPFGSGKELYSNPHNQWKAVQLEKDRMQGMFRSLGLKKVIRENGLVEWFGCRRDTPRCFGSVVDDTPQYLWDGKWTPPCCLAGLRRTARHVFQSLEKSQIRYWLEGGSLLGAIRSGDILPWDYDVDIGIYKEDINRCTWLLRAKNKPTMDEQGFIWEKAGEFYRVHFSQANRLHVDIFPFFSRNGTMTKSTWFKTHKQDIEFPERFLKPLSSIDFVGRTVSAPNNIHDFLELKFGEGAIENPMYPNPQKMASFGFKTAP